MGMQQDLSREQIALMANKAFADLRADVDHGYRPLTDDIDYELGFLQAMTDERIQEVQEQIRTGSFNQQAKALAAAALQQAGIGAANLSGVKLDDLHEAMSRAIVEQCRLVSFRCDDALLPYHCVDKLFLERQVPGAPTAPAASEAKPETGPSLGYCVERYLAAKKTEWVPKTSKARAKELRYLIEHLGADRTVGSIGRDDVRSFRDALQQLKAKRPDASLTFAQRLTPNPAQRISAKTAALRFEPCKAFFRWATNDEGYLLLNPADGVRMPTAKKAKGKRNRRPFTTNELEKLFSAPLFTGAQSPRRRFDPGSTVYRDAKFWLPLLGLYTGARLGELVQLHLGDVRWDGAIPFIEVTEESDEEGKAAKRVKSEAGVRRIPLHPSLLALGFEEFVAERTRKPRKGSGGRLFWDIPFGSDGQASTVYSKWFGRLLDSVGLSDPALVFHSFRHGAEDAFRNSGTQQKITDTIMGHVGRETSDGYGEGIWIETAHDAVKQMKLRYEPLHLTIGAVNFTDTDPITD